ncbi:hypothetical protein [Acrocarpospora catenulata]|uniref:hypothetical protein n=1 Tax=Acrocarpospora catenulata TaxID=2836182 RepID=UPI001BDA2FD7|nr:hypothetical protein [Acrocarpospora catenulata]
MCARIIRGQTLSLREREFVDAGLQDGRDRLLDAEVDHLVAVVGQDDVDPGRRSLAVFARLPETWCRSALPAWFEVTAGARKSYDQFPMFGDMS